MRPYRFIYYTKHFNPSDVNITCKKVHSLQIYIVNFNNMYCDDTRLPGKGEGWYLLNR